MIAFALLLISAPLQDGTADAPKPKPINPATWLSHEDYPAISLTRHEEGIVAFTLDVDAKGRITGCTITSTSNSPTLDHQTCAMVRKRGRFEPARNDAGAPVASTWSSRFTWRFPR